MRALVYAHILISHHSQFHAHQPADAAVPADHLPQAKKATDDSGSSDDEDGRHTLSQQKQVPVKPLPVKTQARKPKETAQEEVVKLLGKIVK